MIKCIATEAKFVTNEMPEITMPIVKIKVIGNHFHYKRHIVLSETYTITLLNDFAYKLLFLPSNECSFKQNHYFMM